MTLNDILSEIQIEFGDHKAHVVTQQTISQRTKNKDGSEDLSGTKLLDANKVLGAPTKEVINKVIAYLKKNNLWGRVSSKLDYTTKDLVMMGDGSAVVNFDDGGSVRIPAEELIKEEKRFLNY